MIKLLQIAWVLLPAGALAYHFGPGQEWLARDKAASRRERAADARTGERYDEAAAGFGLASEALPKDAKAEKQRLALAEADAKILQGDHIEAQERIEALLAELKSDGAENGELALRARASLAKTSYYTAWIMRLEGATAEEWKPEVHRAQQNYRLLAERAQERASAEEERAARENLEAAVRLEQMHLGALYALPLPKDCKCNCESLSQRKRKQCQGKCQGQGKEPKDFREDVKKQKGAGISEREGTGS